MDLPRKEQLTSKGFVVLLCISLVYLGKKYGVPSTSVDCIRDPVHDSLGFLNDFVNANEGIARILQISSSLLMDLVFVTLYGYWMLHISTGRVLYATAIFYAVRGITQLFVTLRFPSGYFWNDPGFPSLVVPYGLTSDFFYSGHCGFLNLCALEWLRIGFKDRFKLVQIINAYMALVMLIFRIHYMVDITTALFMSHYTYILVEQHVADIDAYVLRTYRQFRNREFTSTCIPETSTSNRYHTSSTKINQQLPLLNREVE